MNHDDGFVGKIDAGICAGDGAVIPLRNPAHEDSGQGVGGELHITGDSWNVVGRYVRTQYGRNVENSGLPLLLSFLELSLGHRHIAGAEIYGAFRHLADAAATSNGLIVDLNVSVQLVVFAEPFRIHGIRERSAGSIQGGLACQRQGYKGAQQYQRSYKQVNFS